MRRSIKGADERKHLDTAIVRPPPVAVLLRLAAGRSRLRHHGGRGQCAHRLLAAVSADPRRIRLGPGSDGGRVLVRFSGVGTGHAVGRAADGPARAAHHRRSRSGNDGGGPAAGNPGSRAVAALPDARRVGRRRGQLLYLYGPVALLAELVRAAARAGDQHRVLRGRHRLGDDPALAASADRERRLAHRVLDAGRAGSCSARPAKPAAAAPAGKYRAASGRRLGRRRSGRDCRQCRRPRLGGSGVDTRPGAADEPLLVARHRLFRCACSPGTRCRCIRPST